MSFDTTAALEPAQVIQFAQRLATTHKRPAAEYLPYVVDAALEDFISCRGDSERMRIRNRWPLRKTVDILLLGIVRRLKKIEERMEMRDGFGRPIARKGPGCERGEFVDRRSA